jgi:hypothetical protein
MINDAQTNNTQTVDISSMISNIETKLSENKDIYQILRSSEIKTNISYILNVINQGAYSYVLDINDFIRNNIRDASFLKKTLIEKIQSNMGD